MAVVSVCFSQDSTTNNILTTKKFNRGIYVTFKEFKENSPSITDGFIVSADTSKYDRYTLLVPDSKKKFRNIYGFSDGESIYINAQTYEQNTYFVKILMLGKVIYFEDKRAKTKILGMNNGAIGHLLGGMVLAPILYSEAANRSSKNPGFVIYIPDNDGRPFILEKKTLMSILKEGDKELYHRYKLEENKNDFNILMNYLIQFNNRNLGR